MFESCCLQLVLILRKIEYCDMLIEKANMVPLFCLPLLLSALRGFVELLMFFIFFIPK